MAICNDLNIGDNDDLQTLGGFEALEQVGWI